MQLADGKVDLDAIPTSAPPGNPPWLPQESRRRRLIAGRNAVFH